MGVSEIGFPQNVVYKQRIQTSDTLPVTIGASKYCEFLFDIDAGDRMTPLGIVGWSCNDKTQVFLLDFYMDADLQTAKLILKNPYATTIAISSLYIDVIYSKQALDMSEVDVVDNLTTDSAVAALSAKQGKVLNDKITSDWSITTNFFTAASGYATYGDVYAFKYGRLVWIRLSVTKSDQSVFSQTRHVVGTISSEFRPRTNTSISIPASNNINSYLTRITTAIITTSGDVIIDCYQNNDVKHISLNTFFVSENP